MKKLFVVIMLLSSLLAMAQPGTTGKTSKKNLKAKVSGHSVTLTLTGTGTQPAGVTLTGNNYYRANVTGGPYSLLPSCSFTTVVTLSCVDAIVTAGATYYYVATNLCSACTGAKESPFSNEISAIIPNPTSPTPPVLGNPVVASMNPPTVSISWKLSTVAGITIQKVLRQTIGNPTWVPQKQLKPAVSSYTDLTVKPSKAYAYEVAVYKGAVLAMVSLPSASVLVK